ncbi:MAG: hypothetical protein H6819_05840 [Phycisphaerales bacterium]|nr:hypothetical protein [Phycisphaerales bacterium]MCB9858658.1 hypothetical protein [Phycisphaerales bacterium]
MIRRRRIPILMLALFSAASFATAWAQTLDVDWHTVDSGGEMWSSGGTMQLSGSIGQSDTDDSLVMTGITLSLTGGFWATPPCWCLSDTNHDGLRNGEDIHFLLECVLNTVLDCECADVATDGALDMNDVDAFVADLLSGDFCQ